MIKRTHDKTTLKHVPSGCSLPTTAFTALAVPDMPHWSSRRLTLCLRIPAPPNKCQTCCSSAPTMLAQPPPHSPTGRPYGECCSQCFTHCLKTCYLPKKATRAAPNVPHPQRAKYATPAAPNAPHVPAQPLLPFPTGRPAGLCCSRRSTYRFNATCNLK
eukprot:1157976-Pelagomonas_calceolata.AAC.6